MKICRRKIDGVLFEPSMPDNYDRGKATGEFLAGKMSWYFRRIEWMPCRWWQFKGRWKRTDEIWEPKSGNEFEVIEENKENNNGKEN